MDFVGSVAGQLSKLDEIGGGKAYYVRLAWGHTETELVPFETALLRRYPGGKANHLIEIRSTSNPVGYELVFGKGLTLASAEVFERLSDLQGFANGRPEIQADTP